jgi:hypothetical protein
MTKKEKKQMERVINALALLSKNLMATKVKDMMTLGYGLHVLTESYHIHPTEQAAGLDALIIHFSKSLTMQASIMKEVDTILRDSE